MNVLARRRDLFLALGALCVVVGCAETEVSSECLRVERKSAPLLGALSSQDESVVVINTVTASWSGFCSATLIAPNVLLTARHCLSRDTEGAYVCTLDGFIDDAYPRVPANAGELGALALPEEVGVHLGESPDLNTPDAHALHIFTTATDTVCRNDIAVIELDRDLPGNPRRLRLDKGVRKGEALELKGFGVNDFGKTSRTELPDVPVVAVGASEFFPSGAGSPNNTFTVGKGPCHGDSGGPAFSMETGAVVGVMSRIFGDCASSEARSVLTEVGPFRDLLKSASEKIGVELMSEASSAANGGSGGELPVESNSPKGGCEYSTGRSRPEFDAVVAMSVVVCFWRLRRRAFAS